jgi:hypothetical protein
MRKANLAPMMRPRRVPLQLSSNSSSNSSNSHTINKLDPLPLPSKPGDLGTLGLLLVLSSNRVEMLRRLYGGYFFYVPTSLLPITNPSHT